MKKHFIYIIIAIIVAMGLYALYSKERSYKVQVEEKLISHTDQSDFTIFWNGLQEALKNNDQNQVLKFFHTPFIDGYGDVYDPKHSLTSNTTWELRGNFNQIFTQEVVRAILNNQYRGYNPNMISDSEMGSYDVIKNDEYLLQPKTTLQNRDLIFKKIDGAYKIVGLQYYP